MYSFIINFEFHPFFFFNNNDFEFQYYIGNII